MKDTILSPLEFLNQLTRFITTPDNKCALMLISLDGMKQMASIFSARICEEVVQQRIDLVQQGIRSVDAIHRLGRFEFAILISGILNRGHAVLAANKMSGILGIPVALQNRERRLPFSIGVTLSPEHTSNPEQLWRFADLAIASAKATQVPYVFFIPEDLNDPLTDWDIEGDLEHAITNDELALYYQPKLSTATGNTIGAEALLRWNHPSHGLIPPDRFIPIAEKSGIMPKLTWWVLNTALRERQQWGSHSEDLSIAINISALDLTDNSFVKSVSSAIGLWNTKPGLLTLEITEGALMQDIAFSANILRKIQDLGIKISIDDFGTGYSSLAYFKQLPANELKIDRSFILNILNDELDQHVVSTIVQMAKKMQLEIVAEGVETERIQTAVTELGCDVIQGYHVAKPMPQSSFIAWIAKQDQTSRGQE